MTASARSTSIVRHVFTMCPLLLTFFAVACSDGSKVPTAPPVAEAQRLPVVTDSASLAGMSNRELLLAVLDKLNSIEARVDQESKLGKARLDSAIASLNGLALVPAGAGTNASARSPRTQATQASIEFGYEGSLCVQNEWGADAEVQSSLSLWGGGEGMAGVDAYGNGAKGEVRGFATADTKVIPGGGAKVTLEICGKVNPSVQVTNAPPATAGGSPSLAQMSGTDLPSDPHLSGPGVTLIRNALQAVSLDQIAAAASRLGMDGSRLGRALNAVSNFSLSDLPFGRGAGTALLNSLPMPADVATLVQNPENILQKAADASQFAVDKLCSQTLFTGEFAQRASQACNLRDQVPSPSGLVPMLQGLNGLPQTVTGLRNDLSSACSAINSMRTAKVSIPAEKVDFPLGIGTVTTFPGFSQTLFPNVKSPCQ